MKTFHIHIQGIVQGVGFRPFVYQYFVSQNIKGWVNNTADGVHIHVNTSDNIKRILADLLNNKPNLAVISASKITEIDYIDYVSFEIIQSDSKAKPQLLLTPDFAICKDCNRELYDKTNPRYQYAFITCTNCGPRYSISKQLPYDRETTTMDSFKMCSTCKKEYEDPLNRRYYSQTNSCEKCKIELSLYKKTSLIQNDFKNLNFIVGQWNKGKIIAIKGIGGYLLTCDATNSKVIKRLRFLKNRPSKPFALMYHDIYELAEDVEMNIAEKLELESVAAPIVILATKKKEDRFTPIASAVIAPNLSSIGVMLPYTPLFKLLLNKFKKPIVATSGNLSAASIIYEDNIEELAKVSDFILSNDREIVIPQDDSVVLFSSIKKQRIIIRRSRGLAPSYMNPSLVLSNKSVLALGASLKSTFTLLNNKNIHCSQYLGNTNSFEAEENYKNTLNNFKNLFKPELEVLLIDKHPNYFTSIFGKEIAKKQHISYKEIQHHKAHFYAVLGENNLIHSKEKVMGVIWDGTGLGDDAAIWGGEFFTYQNGKINRVFHLDEFPFILGDKMPKEPRIAAFVMAGSIENYNSLLKEKFTTIEWNIYKKLLKSTQLKSTSMGRLFDAVASIVLGIDKQTYEGEAAMQLENAAYRYFRVNNFTLYYSYLQKEIVPTNFIEFILNNILIDLEKGFEKDFIAAKFHITLAHYIKLVAKKHNSKKIAFSGGVFQNQWLVELILAFMNDSYELYFHKDLSPNDENISFGQLMHYLYDKG